MSTLIICISDYLSTVPRGLKLISPCPAPPLGHHESSKPICWRTRKARSSGSFPVIVKRFCEPCDRLHSGLQSSTFAKPTGISTKLSNSWRRIGKRIGPRCVLCFQVTYVAIFGAGLRPLGCMQAQRRAQDTKKLLAAADSAVSDFEEGSQAWLKLGQQLDTALRQLGDIDNLFDALCDKTADLSCRVVALSTPTSALDAVDQSEEPASQVVDVQPGAAQADRAGANHSGSPSQSVDTSERHRKNDAE